jgi:hypothetical protein
MNRPTNTIRYFILGLLMVSFAACSSSKKTASDEDLPRDITWLTGQLQDDGIFVAERGEPDFNVQANTARRLLLNGREYVDAYYFDENATASAQARIYAGYNPRSSVYLLDGLVAIRYKDDLSEVSSALGKYLGVRI